MMLVQLRDTIGDSVANVDIDDVATTLRAWFPEAPQDVRDAAQALQDGLLAGRYVGGLETLLGVTVDPLT